MLNDIRFSENLRQEIDKYKSHRDKLSDVLYDELLNILRKSNYHHVYIEGELLETNDENGNELVEDRVDNFLATIIHNYNEINPYKHLACELFRGKDF